MSLQTELRQLYRDIGEPAYRVLRQQAELGGNELPPQTITTLLFGPARPRRRTIIAFVKACERYARVNKCGLPPERFDLDRWAALGVAPEVATPPQIDIRIFGEHLDPYREAVVEVCHRLGLAAHVTGEAAAQVPDRSAVVLLVAPGDASDGPATVADRVLADVDTSSVPTHQYVVSPSAGLDDMATFRAAVLRDLAGHRRPEHWGVVRDAGPTPQDSGTQGYYAVPAYVFSQPFTGRRGELETLDEWADAPDPILVIEAIGGVGKSALTWTWFQERAPRSIESLAGRMWWSFYDGSASIVKFLRCAVGYLTGADRAQCDAYDQDELFTLAMSALQERPYLLVLDGLERLLAAYHRFDPAALRDEDVDVNARRVVDPFAADVLRAFAGLTRSKVLISSRLMPDVLNGPSGHPLSGVHVWQLPGLTGDDVVQLVGRLGVTGNRARIEDFFGLLGNHPLLIGAVAGLIRDYRQAPGSFDAWIADRRAGGALRLTELPLSQRRTHVLAAAFAGLRTAHRNTLGCIAILPAPVTFETLLALDPLRLDEERTAGAEHTADVADIDNALRNLESRGLLMWDRASNTYDLHPIVRAFAIDQFEYDARDEANERVRDHFQALPAEDVEQAASVEDLTRTITIFRAMVSRSMMHDAERFYAARLADVLYWRLAAHATVIELLEPFDNGDWPGSAVIALANAYSGVGRHDDALRLEVELVQDSLHHGPFDELLLQSMAEELGATGQLAAGARLGDFMRQWFQPAHRPAYCFGQAVGHYRRGDLVSARTLLDEAAALLAKLPNPPRRTFVAEAALLDTELRWRAGSAGPKDVEDIQRIAGSRLLQPDITSLLHRMALAADAFDAALMHAEQWLHACRNQGIDTLPARAAMARAHARSGRVAEALAIGEEVFAGLRGTYPIHRPYVILSEVFAAAGDGRAVDMAMSAYRQAWCDGPPYALHWPLRDARQLLTRLGVTRPDLPVTDPATVTFPLERQIRDAFAHRRPAWPVTER